MGEGDAKRRRERAPQGLVLGRREQHRGSTDIPTALATILLKRLLILLVSSAASAAICALIFPNPQSQPEEVSRSRA